MGLAAVLGVGIALLVLAAWEWARILVSAFRWAERLLQRPVSGQEGASPDTPPPAGPRSGSQAKRPPRYEGVDGRGGVGYREPHRIRAEDFRGVLVLGVALDPDFESFFGGLEAAVAAGGVLLIAVVVVMAIRRFVSF